MKKILITGANSYIGTSFEKYINENYPNDYIVDTVDMIDGRWREKSFAGYDSVFHVAGIAHQKETKQNAQLYYEVNRDIAIETAQKAKADGVKQFIFLSSMSVYGMDTGIITKETKPNPKSHYGKSKWEAEQGLYSLEDDNFKLCILRPPMVYGKGCKGNFQSVVNIVKKSPIFPNVKNKRSMVYIVNLSSFVEMCVRGKLLGIYFPQNREYVSTLEMAKKIAEALNKKVIFSYLVGLGIKVIRVWIPKAKKAFGSLVYYDTEDFEFSYVRVENDGSFKLSV
ncbi:MAG: NAD-dependent epimerase/dehydratase family protein [Ruminococcaceae bacterium]|nr:NAD-dependent epimerase/dehydratase family protein [Oscillospiraceae bacterium]